MTKNDGVNSSAATLLFATISLCFAGTTHADTEFDQLAAETGISTGSVAMRDMPGWRSPEKVIVLDLHGAADALQATNPAVELTVVRTAAQAIAEAADADAILGFCSEDVISAATRATWVQTYSAGAEDCMDTTRIRNAQVTLTNMQKLSAPEIADHVIALVLALARRLPQFVQANDGSNWALRKELSAQMQSIGDKTLLVVGLGGIGTEVARRAAALEMRVTGTRRSSREGPEFVDYVGLSEELYELAGEADFIVNALPLTPETTGLFDAKFFAAAKPGAHFVNVGRGLSVVTADLVDALRSGKIGGAGLDVTEPEPLPSGHPLWQLDNVIITPHVSSRGGSNARKNIVLRENLRRFLAGEALFNVVDPDTGY